MNFTVARALLLAAPVALRAQSPCPQPTHIAIESGTFTSQPGVTFHLRHFVADLEPAAKTAPACYQKITVMRRGEIFTSNASLTTIFAAKLQNGATKVKNFKVENGVGKVVLSGSITKILPIAFSIEGPVSTDGSTLLLSAARIKADGIPIKALLGLVGEHLSALLNMNGVAGVTVQENSLSFSPEQIAHLRGHIASVECTATGLILRYTTLSKARTSR